MIRLCCCTAGAPKYNFRDKHHQRNGRYQLPSLLQQGHATAASQTYVQESEHAQMRHVETSNTRSLQPKHKALAARLAAAAERQQRRRQRQIQEQRHLPKQQSTGGRHGSWSDQVAADLELVCKELKMPPSVAAALSRAAAKGHISCNPGILLSQVWLIGCFTAYLRYLSHKTGHCTEACMLQSSMQA